jgi:hypothetical protein
MLIIIITILMTSFTDAKNITNNRRRQLGSTHKPISIKICGLALVRMLDMVCTRARQLLMRNEISSSLSPPVKRQFDIDYDLYSRTVSITDYARKFNYLSIDLHIFFFVLLF